MPTPPPVTLRVTAPKGDIIEETLRGPGGRIRFAVGEPGRHGAVWRIFAPRNKSDVYIGVRTILGILKWSLHQSGDWRHQWVTRQHAEEFTGSADRIIDQWRQPPEVGATGWTRGFTIWVRQHDVVAVAPEVEVPADTLWLPPASADRAAVVSIAIARPDQIEADLKGMWPLAGFTLADGRAVLLLLSHEILADEQNQICENAIGAALQAIPAANLSAADNPRGMVLGTNDAGDRVVWDCAIPVASNTETAENGPSPR